MCDSGTGTEEVSSQEDRDGVNKGMVVVEAQYHPNNAHCSLAMPHFIWVASSSDVQSVSHDRDGLCNELRIPMRFGQSWDCTTLVACVICLLVEDIMMKREGWFEVICSIQASSIHSTWRHCRSVGQCLRFNAVI